AASVDEQGAYGRIAISAAPQKSPDCPATRLEADGFRLVPAGPEAADDGFEISDHREIERIAFDGSVAVAGAARHCRHALAKLGLITVDGVGRDREFLQTLIMVIDFESGNRNRERKVLDALRPLQANANLFRSFIDPRKDESRQFTVG